MVITVFCRIKRKSRRIDYLAEKMVLKKKDIIKPLRARNNVEKGHILYLFVTCDMSALINGLNNGYKKSMKW